MKRRRAATFLRTSVDVSAFARHCLIADLQVESQVFSRAMLETRSLIAIESGEVQATARSARCSPVLASPTKPAIHAQ